ncbi:MAG: hypothetical protein ACOCVM_01385, partial [Desulfovibrionaceae bacterium]
MSPRLRAWLAAALLAVLAPAAAQAAAADRPSLYLDSARLAELKSRLDSPPFDAFSAYTLKRARDILAEPVPASLAGYNDNTIRNLGDKLPWLAMAHLITGKAAFADRALEWMDRFAAAPTWASGRDIGAAHVLFGMAVAYDWLHARISELRRQSYRRAMARHAAVLHDLLTGKKIWWARDLLQNHNHTCAMALVAAGVVLRSETPGAEAWFRDGLDDVKQVLQVMPSDGASFEGVGYWSYSLQSLLKAVMAAGAEGLQAAKSS